MPYRLRVSAGSAYDADSRKPVPVNTDSPLEVSSPKSTAQVSVRIPNYSGLPEGSPKTCAYFGYPEHKYDQYSISFSIKFDTDVSFDDLLFGNDFDRPIRDHLPYGFSFAYKIFNYTIDPSATGDVYADKPYLFGYAVSSMNVISNTAPGDSPFLKEDTLSIGPVKNTEVDRDDPDEMIPSSSADRMKYFLDEEHRKRFVFKAGETYWFDFHNPYLDMNSDGNGFAVKLPGYNMSVMKYWDGQPLRYVLKSKSSDFVYLAIVFELDEET
ncbi:hypothetical protein BZA70DRAFT_237238 [Myxozyma melibiosi]|uniref:Domain of unknown function at the cortex 1 domain-containing protein n=1 Tax=Myxozyma melibiosi TaxID=54550 RepID=A0ABR1F717_9ASCO